MIWSIPTMWQFPNLFLMFLPVTRAISRLPESQTYASSDISFDQAYGHVGKACLPSNAYYPRTHDYILYSGVHVCWSEHSDSSFVYGFMSVDYGLGTMTATTYREDPFLEAVWRPEKQTGSYKIAPSPPRLLCTYRCIGF